MIIKEQKYETEGTEVWKVTMKKKFHILSALLLSGILFLPGCGKNLVPDVTSDETLDPADGTKVYTMSIVAGKGETGTKALSLDGSTLSAAWEAGEQVTVYNKTRNAGLEGYLMALTDGESTTLQGTLTGDIEDGDELTLSFLSPRYATQEGTLGYIAENCDYATADVTVESITNGKITTTATAEFTNQQAIVKFKLRNKEDSFDLHASSLTISTSSNKLVTGIVNTSLETTYGNLTITPVTATNELTVALRNENGGADTYTLIANVEGKYYRITKDNVTFHNGKYYEITVKMEELPEYAIDAITISIDDIYFYVLYQPYIHISVSQAYEIAKYLGRITGENVAVVFNNYDSYGETVIDYAVSTDKLALRHTGNCYLPYREGYRVYIIPNKG